MYLGIDDQRGLIYEGMGGPDRVAIPVPTVTQTMLIEQPGDWSALPSGLRQNPMTWMFREDSFDAVTRTRRGRLYYPPTGVGQPSSHRVTPHLNEDPGGNHIGADGKLAKSLHVYHACAPLLTRPDRGLGATLALGTGLAASAWRIVQAELTVSGDVMVTLKALSAFGILPALADGAVPDQFRTEVRGSVQRVLDSAFRESPSSVVEHCRDALQMMISRWLAASGETSALEKELAKASAAIEREPFEKICVANLGKTVALLHGKRGKTNQRLASGARALTEEDAEMCVQAVGFAMRDLGWAKL